MIVYHVRNLTKTYPGAAEPANRDISFQVRQGEIFGILGGIGAATNLDRSPQRPARSGFSHPFRLYSLYLLCGRQKTELARQSHTVRPRK